MDRTDPGDRTAGERGPRGGRAEAHGDAGESDGDAGESDGDAGESDGDAGEMTLAFGLDALTALADPQSVFADARDWAEHVGVVDDDAEAVEAAVARYGLRQDYEVGQLDPQSTLSRLKWEADTERYVYVGTDERERELADYVGWEYLAVEEAAAKAGWSLVEDLGPLARLRRWLGRVQ